MVSNTHEIVISKEITSQSSPNNTYDLNKSDLTESCSSNKFVLPKNEERMKSSTQLDDEDNAENNGVVMENISSTNETIVLDNNNEMFHNEELICDICGDLGFEKLLAICNNCEVGAEHIYCMKVKVNKVPDIWLCYYCIEDLMPEDKEIEETSSKKRKPEFAIDFFKMEEITTSKRRLELLNKQSNYETRTLDLNKDLNLNLNVNPDINMNHGLNLELCLAHASYFQLGSSGNYQIQRPVREFLK